MDDLTVNPEDLNMACFQISKQLDSLTWAVPEAQALARRLLRVVGRVVIDVGDPAADPETWSNTESMALQWIQEAVRPLGYDVTPLAGSNRQPLETS
jgi:hypothetical protein